MGVNTSQQKTIEGIMMGLMKELAGLAPHPDRPDHNGPIFIKIDPCHKPPAEYEGMLGSLVLESFLGTAFAEANSAQNSQGGWTQNFSHIDYSNVIESASQYMQERDTNAKYNLGQKKALSGTFNKRAAWQQMMDAYLGDLPRRLGLERFLSEYQRKLYALQKHAPVALTA